MNGLHNRNVAAANGDRPEVLSGQREDPRPYFHRQLCGLSFHDRLVRLGELGRIVNTDAGRGHPAGGSAASLRAMSSIPQPSWLSMLDVL